VLTSTLTKALRYDTLSRSSNSDQEFQTLQNCCYMWENTVPSERPLCSLFSNESCISNHSRRGRPVGNRDLRIGRLRSITIPRFAL